jgi:hypothetical protein
MARYLDPKNDLTFKRIFGEHPHLLISFLNALLPLAPNRLIKSIEYLSPEQAPENIEEVIDGLEFVLVELEKFKPSKWVDRKMAVLWLRFLSEMEMKIPRRVILAGIEKK